MDDKVKAFRNFISHVIIHIFGLFLLLWFSGALLAYATDSIAHDWKKVGINIEPVILLIKWFNWLNAYWSELTLDAYNYLKVRLVLCIYAPFLAALIVYMKFRQRIWEYKLFEPKEKVYGDASWATQADIRRASLRAKEGMLLGVDNYGYYVADGFQHALLFAPTGSGKGVGFVIPNLLFWSHSVVVHDIKLENHQLTSGWRAKAGQEVYVWEPANPDGVTHCYNPIDWVSSKPGQMVDDVQKIGNLIMPEKDFWNNEARSLFLGVVLYLIADPRKTKSFGEVVRTMRSDDVVYNLAVVLDTMGKIIHPVAYMNIAAFLQKADKERSGVISTMNSSLELWANPLIDAATASSDFNVLEFKKKLTTVYVGLTPDNINRLQKLMQIFYQQSTEFLSRKMPNLKEEPHGVLFLMDEFPTLGKMEQFKAGIAYFRGYRVRLFLIIQDTQQLKGTYEEAGMNSFLSNSTFRVTFAANNYETANLISQLCGNKTVQQESYSKPKFFDLNPATRSVNISQVQRALLLPQEVIQLPRDEQIVLIESFPPIRSKKIKYYADKFFTQRLLPGTFVPTQEPYDPNSVLEASEEENAEAKEEENMDVEEEGVEDEAMAASEEQDFDEHDESDNAEDGHEFTDESEQKQTVEQNVANPESEAESVGAELEEENKNLYSSDENETDVRDAKLKEFIESDLGYDDEDDFEDVELTIEDSGEEGFDHVMVTEVHKSSDKEVASKDTEANATKEDANAAKLKQSDENSEGN